MLVKTRMLTIRLTRKGKKNQPFFRVVVIDKRRSSKGGRPSEILGYVDPLTKRKSLKKERILHWIKVGAKPSPTVHNLLVTEKIIDAKKISKFKKSKKVAPVVASTAAPAAAQPTPTVTPAIESKAVETPAPAAETSSSAKASEDKKEEPKP